MYQTKWLRCRAACFRINSQVNDSGIRELAAQGQGIDAFVAAEAVCVACSWSGF
jgi:hypothetical protein